MGGWGKHFYLILSIFHLLKDPSPPAKKFRKPARIPPQTPPPRGQNPKQNQPKFCKTSSTELALEFRQFLLWRNPTSPATTIQNQKRNPPPNKKECVVARRGRSDGAGTEPNTLRCSVEWTLRRDGIRRGAYDYISHCHALRACHIISLCFENRF